MRFGQNNDQYVYIKEPTVPDNIKVITTKYDHIPVRTVMEPPRDSTRNLQTYRTTVHKTVVKKQKPAMGTAFLPDPEPKPNTSAISKKPLPEPHTQSYQTGYNVMEPIHDYHTKNTSFLKVQKQLEILGVRNNDFFLILLNPRLQGVDPYDKNITPELAIMIEEECRHNIFYYLREVVRIPQQGAGMVPFELDRGTLAALYCFINDINFYLIKPRQTGKSVGICAFLSWAFKFGISNGAFAFFANKDKNAKANLKRMKTYINNLPSYLANMGTVTYDSNGKAVRKTNNITRYEEPESGNMAYVMGCAVSEESAEEIGRGDSHNFELYDEAEFTKYIETIVQVSGPAFNTASYNALTNGMHSCRCFASTPGDLSDEQRCGSAMKIVNDAVTWEEDFYNIHPLALKRRIAKKSKYRVVYIEYNYKQLGYGEAWFIRACSTVGGNVPKIKRELLLERFSGNNQSPFSEEDINEINDGVQKPVKILSFGRAGFYKIKFYCDPAEIQTNRIYFAGLDPSDGTGGDNYALTVIDPYTFKTIIEFETEYMSPLGCRELLDYLLAKFIPRTIVCVENNRNGTTLIDFLKMSKRIKPRLYSAPEASMDTFLLKEEYDEIGFLKDELMKRKYFGVSTTPTSREMMMGLLTDSVKFRKDILTTENLVRDIKNLIIKNDKIQAAPKKHDDSVMSWCIAMYVYYFGTKLERFGFKRGALPDDVVMDDEYQQLQELYKDPYIRAQFPTMFNYYEHTLKERLKRKHDESVQMTLNNVTNTEVGSIQKDLEQMDPNYNEAVTTEHLSETATNIRQRWNSMNRRLNKQTDRTEDLSWV